MSFREVNDDMLKDWLEFRDQTVLAYTTKEDKKHTIEFDEICEKILNSVPKQNRKFIQKQFNQLDDNLMDYISYWNKEIAIEKITPLLSYEDIIDSKFERIWDWDLISSRVADVFNVLLRIKPFF